MARQRIGRRRLRSLAVAAVVAAAILGPAGEAIACSGGPAGGCGGVWLRWDRPYYKPGEVAHGEAELVWPKKTKRPLGRPGDGPYSVYLRHPSSRLGRNPERDASAVRVGTLSIGAVDKHRIGEVSVTFTVPSIRAGRYLVQYCAPGCKLRPGSLADTELTIVTNDVEERELISSRIDDAVDVGLRAQSHAARAQYRARKNLRAAKKELETTISSLESEVADLEDALERVRDRKPPQEDDTELGIMALAGSLVIAGALVRRRHGSMTA